MANSEYTQEERERAARDIDVKLYPVSDEVFRKGSISSRLRSILGEDQLIVDLQCSLNRLQEQVKEARELLERIENSATTDIPLDIRFDLGAWLEATK